MLHLEPLNILSQVFLTIYAEIIFKSNGERCITDLWRHLMCFLRITWQIKRAKVAHVRKVDNPYSLDKSLFTDKAIGFPITLGTVIQRLNN